MKLFLAMASAIALSGVFAPAATAHEFWIDGTVVEVETGTAIDLDLKVGQNLEGASLPYIPNTIDRFEWVQGAVGDISATIGDVPAARVPLPRSENAIIFHRTKPRRLIHKDWQKFHDYLRAEGAAEIARTHKERGLPMIGFTETYSRHAKLAVLGESSDGLKDRYMGSPLEFVLETAEHEGHQIELTGRLMGQTDPERHQISVFQTTPDGVRHSTTLTDASGRFKVTTDGTVPLLLNSVQITPVQNDDTVWHSDWASIFVMGR